MLSNLLSLSWVLLINGNFLTQTHYVIYSTTIDKVMIYYVTREKSDTMCYINYSVKVGYFYPFKGG